MKNVSCYCETHILSFLCYFLAIPLSLLATPKLTILYYGSTCQGYFQPRGFLNKVGKALVTFSSVGSGNSVGSIGQNSRGYELLVMYFQMFLVLISDDFVEDPHCQRLFEFMLANKNAQFILLMVGKGREWRQSNLGMKVSELVSWPFEE